MSHTISRRSLLKTLSLGAVAAVTGGVAVAKTRQLSGVNAVAVPCGDTVFFGDFSTVRGMRFVDQRIVLGGPAVIFKDCLFDNCRFTGEGGSFIGCRLIKSGGIVNPEYFNYNVINGGPPIGSVVMFTKTMPIPMIGNHANMTV